MTEGYHKKEFPKLENKEEPAKEEQSVCLNCLWLDDCGGKYFCMFAQNCEKRKRELRRANHD